jgi:peptidoglycan-associated lipoprotein
VKNIKHPRTATAGHVALTGALLALLGACSSPPPATPAAAPAPQAAPATSAPAPAAVQATTQSRVTPVAEPAQAARPAPTPAPAAAAQPTAPGTATARTLPAHLDPASDISTRRSVYFDFDKAAVKPDSQGVVERHGKYLSSSPELAIRIEGNTDERGSAEYNLALGHKRAEAVRQALKLLGVRDAQMEAVSLGKERPKATGHDEAAWAENRRADLQYPAR